MTFVEMMQYIMLSVTIRGLVALALIAVGDRRATKKEEQD